MVTPSVWSAAAVFFTVGAATAIATKDAAASPIEIGTRLELFIDSHLIDRLEGTRLKLHEPRPAGSALTRRDPWDGNYFDYGTILHDQDLYRMYYRSCVAVLGTDDWIELICYAESRDGVAWSKPDLGLHDFGGSKHNNIILRKDDGTGAIHNFAPFLDTRPGVPKKERYKAIGGAWPKGLFVLVSEDGIRWRKWRDEAVFKRGAFDSQNVLFWSEAENCYVLYFRTFSGVNEHDPNNWMSQGYRTVSKTTSPDLINWSEPKRMSFGPGLLEHFYTNQTHPYFRAPHIYVGMAMRYMPGRRFLSNEQFSALGVEPAYLKGGDVPGSVSDTVFFTSRGGYRYDRTFMEAFIRPGPNPGNWVVRNGVATRGIVRTGPAEMSVYVGQDYGQPTAHLERFVLRLDGFASVHASATSGEMVTKPLIVGGSKLIINAATSAAGSIRIELQETDGEPIPGYSLAESEEFVGDGIEHGVSWKMGADMEKLQGQAVRVRFVMRDADVYSMRFR